MELTPEQLASGEWFWDEDIGDFVSINAPKPEPEEKPKEKPKTPTQAIAGMKWNGTKLS